MPVHREVFFASVGEKRQLITINFLSRVNETEVWVRVTSEGGDSFSLELQPGLTYQLRRRRENPGLWMVSGNQTFRRESDTKVVNSVDGL